VADQEAFRFKCKKHNRVLEGKPFFTGHAETSPFADLFVIDMSDMYCPQMEAGQVSDDESQQCTADDYSVELGKIGFIRRKEL
jgi:hypothetical protein